MKVVVLGDLHFISPQDPFDDIVAKRRHFAEAWPSFQRLGKLIRREAPDLIISVGDIVDWYSPQNRDFGIGLLDELQIPWMVTPGNHDFQGYRPSIGDQGVREMILGPEYRPVALAGWQERQIDLTNRVVDAGSYQLLLMESALSSVPEGTERWLQEALASSERNILFTHVPLNLPQVGSYIHSVDSKRNLTKYYQSGAPHLFRECLDGRVQFVFNGHLHFPGAIEHFGTTSYLLPLSITPERPSYPGQGGATVLKLDGPEMEMYELFAAHESTA